MLQPFLHFPVGNKDRFTIFPSSFALAFPFFDPIIQLFLTWARDPLSSTNDLARISKNPVGVEEAWFTISIGTILLSRAALGSRLHDQFRIRLHDTDRLRGPHPRAASAVIAPGKMERYIVFELCILFTVLLLCYVLLYIHYTTSKLLLFLSLLTSY